MWLLALTGCRAPDPLTVWIRAGPGLRDLEAVVDGPVRIRWFEDDTPTPYRSRIVPAEALWPGARWRVDVEDRIGRRASASYEVPEPPGGNVVIVLFDDLGVDKVGSYGGPYAGFTPNLDALAAEGLRFSRAYASSVCSPSRASLLTGRHPHRHGVGWIVDTGTHRTALPLEEHTIPEVLRATRAEPYANAALGKWHLAGARSEAWLRHPNDQGFDHFAGAPGNPEYREGRGYYAWTKNVNGKLEESTTYMTIDTTDDAIALFDTLPEPFFLYVAYNAVHGPLQLPPAELVRHLPDGPLERPERYDLVLEAADRELGRFLASIDPDRLARTTFFVLGDNGTFENAIPEPWRADRFKHTPYEGGVHVPLIVTGPHVARPGTVSDALVHVVDILPTVAEIAGVPLAGPEGSEVVLEDGARQPLDGRSMLPVLQGEPSARRTVYTEAFHGSSSGRVFQRAARNRTHKLIQWGTLEEFYPLEGPMELDVEPLAIRGLDQPDRDALDELRSIMDLYEELGSSIP